MHFKYKKAKEKLAALEKKLDELKIDWRGSVEYRHMNMHQEPYDMERSTPEIEVMQVQREGMLLQSLKDSYRSSINYRDSRREQ